MARRTMLRASDADREQIAERLREAATEGRLLAEELEQRLGNALKAKTYGELDALVDDLPAERGARPRTSAVSYLRPALIALGAMVLVAAVIAVVALIVTGTIFVGGAWIFIAFWFFGRRGGHHRRPRRLPQRYHGSAGYAPWQG